MRKCELCGANLDPQEKCDCREEVKEDVQAYAKAKANKGCNSVCDSDGDYVLRQIRELKAALNDVHC